MPLPKAGDKVKCINNSKVPMLTVGVIYTIDSIMGVNGDLRYLLIEERSFTYLATRFELVSQECICTIQDLMIKGCTCGHLAKE